ncbi:MAG: hypothetical protein ABIH85_03820 [Candidatus Omnitrophota bacterium]|nr:hypothetical protein [Candidatus Omnitrophota bacterium]MBU1894222.1 hypothetical protein [Candidatus Omnitrophota bacterium]
MGKILSLLIGGLMVIAGVVLLFVWGYEFLFMLRGAIPLVLIMAGFIALAAGISEFKDVMKNKVGK